MVSRRTTKRRKKTKPVIGISCEVHKLKPFFSEFELTCDYRYVRAILRAGGIPLLLPIVHNKSDLRTIVRLIDGLVIIGGGDIHPSFYGEKDRHRVEPMYRGRIRFDTRLYRLMQQKKIPVLAICYGMQLLNVIYGGTLYQDIRKQLRGARTHNAKRNPMHHVRLKKDSDIARILGKTAFTVHSEHHQAVKRLGRSLWATGYSPDSVIEVIEGPPQTVAVQWHPERQEHDPVQKRLFNSFVRSCRRRGK